MAPPLRSEGNRIDSKFDSRGPFKAGHESSFAFWIRRKIVSTQLAGLPSSSFLPMSDVDRRLGIDMGLGLSLFTLLLMTASVVPQVLPPMAIKVTFSLIVAVLTFKLVTFRRWNDEVQWVPRFLVCLVLALGQLAVENGLVFVISAVDRQRLEYVPGLQDNMEILLNSVYYLKWFASRRWMDTISFLILLLALPFSSLWNQIRYSGFGLMSRVLATMFISRTLRVLCFMTTILPSPRPGCSLSRFPHFLPDTPWGIFKAGYTEIRGFGGCNDLIFSGHGAFWILAPLAYQSYAVPGQSGWKSVLSYLSIVAQWIGFLQASLRDVIDRQHYSVDMLLAAVVVSACWMWTERVYPISCQIQQRPRGTNADEVRPAVLLLVAMSVAISGIIVIGGKA